MAAARPRQCYYRPAVAAFTAERQSVGQTMSISTKFKVVSVTVTALAAVSAFSAPGALAMEPVFPAPTRASLVGEWAGYWRDKPGGTIVHFTLTLDTSLRGTIVRSMKRSVVVIYDIDETTVTSGTVLIRAHDRAYPKGEAIVEAKGGVWEDDGWLDAKITDRGNHVGFDVCLEKAPDALARNLQRMLSRARKAARATK